MSEKSVRQLIAGAEAQTEFYPKQLMQNVLDGEAGENLYAYLSKFNHINVGYVASTTAAYNAIPEIYRKTGFIITYHLNEKPTTKQFIGTKEDAGDDNWLLDSYWQLVDGVGEVDTNSITLNQLSKEVLDLLGKGNHKITNYPDGEDLTEVDACGGNGKHEINVLKFADKKYNPANFSGLGRVYLRKNIVKGKNVLTQEMINFANTRYIIQYDYDLNEETITIPEGCVLQFEGGSLSNGVINGFITVKSGKVPIFSNITVKLNIGYPEWFKSTSISKKLEWVINSANTIILEGEYYLDDKIVITNVSNKVIKGNGTIVDGKNKVNLSNGGQGDSFYGLQFTNCSSLSININHKSINETGGKISSTDISKYSPALLFDSCNNVNCSFNINGSIGVWGEPGFSQEFCYILLQNNSNVLISEIKIGEDTTLGEPVILKNNSNITVYNIVNPADGTWSTLKDFNNTNINIVNIIHTNKGTGNPIDIYGENHNYSNIIIRNGQNLEAIDLTSELEDQQYINNITVSNLNCDTAIGIGTINLDPANRLLDIGKVVVNNMTFTPEESLKTTVHTIGVANAWIKDLVISKSKFNGCNHIVSTYVYRNSHAYVNNNEYIRGIDRVVTINDSSIEVENVFYSGCYIDVAGKCFINNTTFRGKDIIGSLVFEDSFGDQSHGIYKDDLSKSPTKIIITDCSFKDLYIYIGANTEFINCVFDNCAFFELSSKFGKGFQNFSCKFKDSKFNYVSENSANSSTGRFISIDHLKILNCTFDGIAPNRQGVASFGRTKGVENSYINIYNSIYNVSRSSGGSNSLVSTSEYENIKLIGNYIKSKSFLVAFSDFGKEHFLLCKENNCGDNNQSIYFSLTETSSPNLSIIFDNNKMVWNSDSNYNLAAIFRLCNGNYIKNCIARNNISIEDNIETKYIYSKVIEI